MIHFLWQKLFRFEYLNQSQLDGLDKYKYTSVDTSPLSKYMMHPFWNAFVEFFPLWVAPNLMTFAGFGLLVLGYCVVGVHDFGFGLPLRRAGSVGMGGRFCRPVWVSMFLLQLVSHTLDGLDGKQARRTGSSSALGELFDHGLDSWACGFFPLPFFSVVSVVQPFGLSPMEMHLFLWLIYTSFFLSHWEKYNTSILYLPWSYDLSMLLLALCYLLVSVYSPDLFQFTFPVIGTTFSRTVLIILAVSVTFLSLPLSVWNVLRSAARPHDAAAYATAYAIPSYSSFSNGTHVWSSKAEVLRPVSSMLVLFSTSTYWIARSANNIATVHPRAFFLAISTTFSNLVCRLIVAEMSQTKCKPFNLSLIPYVLVVIASTMRNTCKATETNMLSAYTCYIIIAHVHFGCCVVRQIATHLHISVFQVTTTQQTGQADASNTNEQHTNGSSHTHYAPPPPHSPAPNSVTRNKAS